MSILIHHFKQGAPAGMLITLGCAVYVALYDVCRPLGAFMFSLGLLTIVHHKFSLYTGLIGYFATERQKDTYALGMTVIWINNFIGACVVGLLLKYQSVFDFTTLATQLYASKLNHSFMSLLIMGIFCGVMMHIAAYTWRAYGHIAPTSSALIVMLCVATFILCGFEHCIADMGYFFMSSCSFKSIYVLLPVTIGNTIGGCITEYFINTRD